MKLKHLSRKPNVNSDCTMHVGLKSFGFESCSSCLVDIELVQVITDHCNFCLLPLVEKLNSTLNSSESLIQSSILQIVLASFLIMYFKLFHPWEDNGERKTCLTPDPRHGTSSKTLKTTMPYHELSVQADLSSVYSEESTRFIEEKNLFKCGKEEFSTASNCVALSEKVSRCHNW